MRAGSRVLLVVVVLLAVVAGLVIYFAPMWVVDQAIHLRLWQQGVKSEYVEAGGYRLHYFEAGDAGGAPLVLVHGLGARAEDWGALMPGLAEQGFHVYAPDLLGYGRSPRPDASYSIPMEEAVVISFMDAVGVKRADVGGWSMGGWIAMKLALDHPERVERLAVYDSAGTYFPPTFGVSLFVPSDVAGVHRLIAVLTPKRMWVPDFVARDIARRLQKNGWVVERSLAAMMSGRDLLDFRLYGMSRPMLVMWGSKDGLISLSVGEAIHRMVPESRLEVVEGCGHLTPAECSGQVLTGTVEFFKAKPAIVGGEEVLGPR